MHTKLTEQRKNTTKSEDSKLSKNIRGGTVPIEDVERARKNILHYIENSTSSFDKNDVKGWVYLLYRAAKRKVTK